MEDKNTTLFLVSMLQHSMANWGGKKIVMGVGKDITGEMWHFAN
jgi:hypothetical protein